MSDEEEEGDYVKTPGGRLGSKVAVSVHGERFLGEFDSCKKANKAIREDMKRQKFYPNVWWISDHGNVFPSSARGSICLHK